MSNIGMFGMGSWMGIVSALLFVASFYFTLTFFEQLKSEDGRVRKQSKIAAVICLTVALLLPAVYQLYFVNEMMR
ncbi:MULTISPECIES: hypothetical protein [unclassified Planococcus (in: firmicutes)]|uniref:hypothetical protein n=1 Tax=Planococcus TaxID=1372 RepID=UPI000C31DA19|nr:MULTISPECIES: hypothetical protein [unclassified Planococcus (in: firmicutes)]AUD15176.1 hypothetical protein CW734_17670 [Planococcus sp. MB-3u-03]PKG46309.1 hypothetical protein CXF66_07970 [Planococcus sp. Urea-trap-24]PKG90095.1 hypothetical protein CXF91_04315 [Planococcus sp. Urea-3u-39]PKH35807.1 hypothetical protein CXF77_16745 [Planococcus sp. MB-3u-09]